MIGYTPPFFLNMAAVPGVIYIGPNQWLPNIVHGGSNVNVPPGNSYCVGTIRLANNVRHDLMHGDRLWYSYSGQMANHPKVEVYSAYGANRNFGAPNVMRRSNMALIGHVSYDLYYLLHQDRGNHWDRTGPRLGQHYRRRINLKVIEQARFRGMAYNDEIEVVAWWR